MARLTGKVAVITGGAGSIGIAAGKLFAREGAGILLVDRNEEMLEKAVQSFQEGQINYVVADVTNADHTQRFKQAAIDLYGGIDIFVANAGIEGVVKPITDYPSEVFDNVIKVNVRGVWLGLKYIIPEIKRRGGGSIVITSSDGGIKGAAGVSAYVASKHAVIGIMRTAALECAPMGIRVNTVNPSPIESPMMRSLEKGFAPEAPLKAQKGIIAATPLKRYGTPEEVAQLMLFLASDESQYCTGCVYMIDGGRSAG